ncbi:DUF4266 domain-containing protein [Bacterioplanoides sp.]|uniref:DUF4266 domain-containing protein n=1 Tax=Bacterioplanoides sp. TaxID=2066072 RepID=UPI003B007C21
MKRLFNLQPIAGFAYVGFLSVGIFISGCSSVTHEKPGDAFQSSMDVKVSIDEPLLAGSEKQPADITPKLTPEPALKPVLMPKPKASPRITKPVTAVAVKSPVSPDANKESAEETAGIWSQIKDFFTIEKVRPWQKATLAKETMKASGPIPGAEKFTLKIYTSKEGSRGGTGVAGGGCGCN